MTQIVEIFMHKAWGCELGLTPGPISRNNFTKSGIVIRFYYNFLNNVSAIDLKLKGVKIWVNGSFSLANLGYILKSKSLFKEIQEILLIVLLMLCFGFYLLFGILAVFIEALPVIQYLIELLSIALDKYFCFKSLKRR